MIVDESGGVDVEDEDEWRGNDESMSVVGSGTQDDIPQEECCGGGMEWEWDEADDSFDENELISLMRGIAIGNVVRDDDENEEGMNVDDDEPEPGPGPGYIGIECGEGTAPGTGTPSETPNKTPNETPNETPKSHNETPSETLGGNSRRNSWYYSPTAKLRGSNLFTPPFFFYILPFFGKCTQLHRFTSFHIISHLIL